MTYINLEPLADEKTVARHMDILEGLRLDLKIAADGMPAFKNRSPLEICTALYGVRTKRKDTLRRLYDAASAVYAHELYMENLVSADKYPSLPDERCGSILKHSFGSPANFFYLVRTLAAGTHAPGFLWMYEKKDRGHIKLGLARLPLYTLPSLSEVRPLMCIDLWEHAYIECFGGDISGYADSCLRQTDWNRIFSDVKKW